VTDARGWIHVIYWDGNYLHYKRWRPSNGWSNDTELETNNWGEYDAAIALDSSDTSFHIAWMCYYNSTYNIVYWKCKATGATGNGGWDPNFTLISTDNNGSCYSYYPTIACSPGGQVHVCWFDYAYGSSFYAISYAEYSSGAWQKIVHLDSTSTTYYKYYPCIAAGRNHSVAIAWYGYDPVGGTTYYHIYCVRRASGTWQSVEQVDVGSGAFNYYEYNASCAISPKDNSVHVVWTGYATGYIYDAIQANWYSYDSSKWGNTTLITPEGYPTGEYQYNPYCCATPDGRVDAIWYGYNSNYDDQIKYAERSAGGVWGPQGPVSTVATTYELYPSIETDSAGGLNAVWMDERNGYYDIYYRHCEPPFKADLTCLGILKPGGLIPAGQPVKPTLTIMNVGLQKQSNFTYAFWVDSSGTRIYTGSGTYSGTLMSESTAHCSMTTSWTPSSAQFVTYNLTGFCNLSGDQYRGNDTQYIANATTCSFVNDFETDNGDLINNPGTGWAWGVPGTGHPAAHSGTMCWGDKLTGNIGQPIYDTLIANNMIATVSNPKVAWYSYYYFYPYYNYGGYRLRYSTDGRKTWTMCHAWPGHGRGYDMLLYGPPDSAYAEQGSSFNGGLTWERMFHIVPVTAGTPFALGWECADEYYGYYPGVQIDDEAGFGFRYPVNVGVSAIYKPNGTTDSNTTFTPMVQVTNYGRTTTTFYTRLMIGNAAKPESLYVDSALATNIVGKETLDLTFKPVALLNRGTWNVKCSTMLATDDVHADDAMMETLDVRVKDVGVRMIKSPPDTVILDSVFYPGAVYHNYGTDAESFNCHFQIDAPAYDKSKPVTLLPGAETSMVFLKDSLLEGSHMMKAFIQLPLDANWHNDTLAAPLFCSRHDVGAKMIIFPNGIVPQAPPMPCSVLVSNFGLFKENFYVKFMILDNNKTQVYADSLMMHMTPSETMTVAMPHLWSPAAKGFYRAKAQTMLPIDQAHVNDSISLAFQVNSVFNHDPAVIKINAPVSIIDTIKTLTPSATVANYASQPDNFEAYFWITGPTHYDAPIYSDSYAVSNLGAGKNQVLTFKPWAGKRDSGIYTATCSVYVARDTYTANDKLSAISHVKYNIQTGWITKLPYMLPGFKGKPVNDGGALAYNTEGATGYVYGFKGNNLTEFYKFNPGTNLWTTAESIPWVGSSGKKKGVKTGGAIASLNGRMYAVKGNTCNDFFVYNPTPGSGASHWLSMPSVGGVAIKNGCGVATIPPSGVAPDTLGYVYLLKGSTSFEFWRYDLVKAIWQQMANAPSGPNGRSWKTGSCLASDGVNIYALKAGYNEFYRFVVSGDSWIPLNPLPSIGQAGHKKVVGDGGALACLNGNVYALKGNNTSEFWEYANGSWVQWPDMPAGTGKYVKGGGALTASPEQVYALKGNNTLEFYGYIPTMSVLASTPLANKPSDNVQDSKVTAESYHLSIAPNPFNGTTHVSYSLPRAGNVSVKLYDVTGTLVTVVAAGYSEAGVNHTVVVDASKLARGIYVLKLASDSYNTTAKLILQ
jgi:hypothetical protein